MRDDIKRAAEEVERYLQDNVRVAYDGSVPVVEMNTSQLEIAAIILRHCGEAERVLLQAAKWAAENIPCMSNKHFECSKWGECEMIMDKHFQHNCWLEYWRKEAAPCREK